MRVVIPRKFQERMLEELHGEHLGVVRMKALARSYFWFPGIDKAIEAIASSCGICHSLKADPPPSPLYPWRYPERPWDRVHVDFAEYKSEMFLVVVDAYSKWMEIVLMKSTTSEKTVDVLRELFSRYGLCREIVSDNGPQFISQVFQDFVSSNGVKHTLTPPYHPASNGSAERAVQTLKNALKRHALEKQPGVSTQQKLCSFLLSYRTTPHTVTGVSPAELFMKRQLRTRLSLLRPDVREAVENKQEMMKSYRDGRVPPLREFVKNERVRVKNCRGSDIRFVPGIVVERLGPVKYLVRVGRNIRYVHVDHIRKTGEVFDDQDVSDECHDAFVPVAQAPPAVPVPQEVSSPPRTPVVPQSPAPVVPQTPVPVRSPAPQMSEPGPRRSGRVRQLPKSLSKDFVLTK